MSNYVDKLHKMLMAGWGVDEWVLTVVLCCKRVLWPRGSRLKHPTSGADYLLLWDLCWVGWECRLCRKSLSNEDIAVYTEVKIFNWIVIT